MAAMVRHKRGVNKHRLGALSEHALPDSPLMSPKLDSREEIVILADGQKAIVINPFKEIDTTKKIVRVVLVKLHATKVNSIEIQYRGRMAKSHTSVEFETASPSTHRRKIDYLATWVVKALTSAS